MAELDAAAEGAAQAAEKAHAAVQSAETKQAAAEKKLSDLKAVQAEVQAANEAVKAAKKALAEAQANLASKQADSAATAKAKEAADLALTEAKKHLTILETLEEANKPTTPSDNKPSESPADSGETETIVIPAGSSTALPQTGESQNKSAFLAGIVALLASASLFAFGKRKKNEK